MEKNKQPVTDMTISKFKKDCFSLDILSDDLTPCACIVVNLETLIKLKKEIEKAIEKN